MIKIEDLSSLMFELIGNYVANNTEFSERALEIINEIADYAEGTELFKFQKEKGEMFDGSTPKQIFWYMLDRVVKAPTTFHRNASCILIMPFLRKALQEKNNEMEDKDAEKETV